MQILLLNGMSPTEALLLIKQAGDDGTALWVSRGDESGTHSKEKRLWAAAGLKYTEIRTSAWYLEGGTGMTATLQLTDQKDAYTLCDMGSYLSNFAKGNIQLEKIVEAGNDTLNVYTSIACNPQTITQTKFDASMAFIISGTGSSREYIQRLGRILRKQKGKTAKLFELVTRDTLESRISQRRHR